MLQVGHQGGHFEVSHIYTYIHTYVCVCTHTHIFIIEIKIINCYSIVPSPYMQRFKPKDGFELSSFILLGYLPNLLSGVF